MFFIPRKLLWVWNFCFLGNLIWYWWKENSNPGQALQYLTNNDKRQVINSIYFLSIKFETLSSFAKFLHNIRAKIKQILYIYIFVYKKCFQKTHVFLLKNKTFVPYKKREFQNIYFVVFLSILSFDKDPRACAFENNINLWTNHAKIWWSHSQQRWLCGPQWK